MVMEKYYSIRVVNPSSDTEEAIEKVCDADFDEGDELCDLVLTEKELMSHFPRERVYIEQNRRELLYQMHKIVERVNKAYSTDFTCHDIPNLVLNDFQPFVWAVREHGTHLYWCDGEIEPSKAVLNYYKDRDNTIEWYHWDGKKLNPTTADEILSGKFWEIKKEETING